jgi:hypothetical protein
MSNIFEEIEQDAKKVEQELLGPSYKYYEYISTPMDMGMSADANLGALVKDAGGLINYVELLVSGQGPGSTTGRPLGDQFFLKTGAQCTDINTKQKQTRYLYFNNIPTGSIPFISSGLGMDFPMFKGLIPSVLQDMDEMNPFSMFKGFLAGDAPNCQEITMPTSPGSTNNYQTRQTEFVSSSDIQEMDPCLFSLMGNVNPVTGDRCKEAFSNMYGKSSYTPKRDPVLQLYILVITLLGLYILYRFLLKKK